LHPSAFSPNFDAVTSKKMEYRLNLSGCSMNRKGCSGLKIKKLNTFDWLCDLPQAQEMTDWVEVQFKNTRKGYYLNSTKIPLEKGDVVAVESSPGHDIGEVTLVGALVLKQMKKNSYRFDSQEVRRVYRKARPVDLEKYEEAKALEHDTMLRSRKIAENLQLNMKIGDVEYQGDGNKAIFYYIADDRVDFRQLIKVLAETFKVRIEMKQIGARQEAGRIGGVGPCGRELCCSSWLTSFVSVSTSAARYQDLSLNPQKLAGQCAKLKCCLNYETDMYAEAQRDIPSKDIALETLDGNYYFFKADYFKRMITYSTSKDFLANAVVISVDRAKQVIALNKKGIQVDSLSDVEEPEVQKSEFGDILGQDALNRFDKTGRSGKNKHREHGPINRPERQTGERSPRMENRGPRPEGESRNSKPEGNHHGSRPEGEKRPEGIQRPEVGQRSDRPRPERDQQNRGNNQPNRNAEARQPQNPGQDKSPNRNPNKNKKRNAHPGGNGRFEKPQKPGGTGSENQTSKE
jgi:cell fate regulator YaaT (PSP1 superfamily)